MYFNKNKWFKKKKYYPINIHKTTFPQQFHTRHIFFVFAFNIDYTLIVKSLIENSEISYNLFNARIAYKKKHITHISFCLTGCWRHGTSIGGVFVVVVSRWENVSTINFLWIFFFTLFGMFVGKSVVGRYISNKIAAAGAAFQVFCINIKLIIFKTKYNMYFMSFA